MDHQALAELLFPHVTETCEEVEARFPARNLPEGAVVSRMAPSPIWAIWSRAPSPSA